MEVGEPTFERASKLLEAELGDEIVALDLDGGHSFGFNSAAASVWRHLEQPKSFEALIDLLIEEFDVTLEQCRAELHDLLDDLGEKGLIRQNRDARSP